MLINIENMEKKYKCDRNIVNVFDNLNLSINQGDFVSITGKSGCGKSTLLRIIGYLENFDTGNYFFDNVNISNYSETQLALIRNQKIGFVFQNFNLIPEYTVFENIEVPLGYAGISCDERKKRIEYLLNDIELLDKKLSYPNQLSGGQQQRIAIARALANNPVLLLADEPTGNLDSDNTKLVMKLFKKLNKKGVTIIMVTHDFQVASYADINYDFLQLLNESRLSDEKK